MLVDQGFLKDTLTLRASGLSCGEEHENIAMRESWKKSQDLVKLKWFVIDQNADLKL